METIGVRQRHSRAHMIFAIGFYFMSELPMICRRTAGTSPSTPERRRTEAKHYTAYAGCLTWMLTGKTRIVSIRDGALSAGVRSARDNFQHRKSTGFHGLDQKNIRRVAKGRNADLGDLYLHNILDFSPQHFIFVAESGCDRRVRFRRTTDSPRLTAQPIQRPTSGFVPGWTRVDGGLRRGYIACQALLIRIKE